MSVPPPAGNGTTKTQTLGARHKDLPIPLPPARAIDVASFPSCRAGRAEVPFSAAALVPSAGPALLKSN
jgi:hypothetical protein